MTTYLSLAQTRNIIESQTKCDPGLVVKDAGSLTYEISFEGQYIDTTSTGGETDKASHDYLKTRSQRCVTKIQRFWHSINNWMISISSQNQCCNYFIIVVKAWCVVWCCMFFGKKSTK